MQKKVLKILFLLVFSSFLHCGAPTKTAEDVAPIFKNGQQLGLTFSKLCLELLNRNERPNLKESSLTFNDCGSAGQHAQNLSGLQEVDFAAFDSKRLQGESSGAPNLSHISMRNQIWLNKSLLGIAAMLADAIEKGKSQGSGTQTTPISSDNGLTNAKITVTRPFRLDKSTKRFDAQVNLQVDGAVKIFQDLDIVGQILGNNVAVNVTSIADQPIEKSLFKNVKMTALVVPFASDIYLDVVLDIDLHSVGVDSLIVKQIKTAVTNLFKKGIDSLLSVSK